MPYPAGNVMPNLPPRGKRPRQQPKPPSSAGLCVIVALPDQQIRPPGPADLPIAVPAKDFVTFIRHDSRRRAAAAANQGLPMGFFGETVDCRITTADLQDASDQAAMLPSQPTYHQVTAGPYRGRIRELRLGRQRFIIESQNQTVLKQGVMSAGTCVVSFGRRLATDARFSEYPILPQSVYFCPGGTALDARLPANSEVVLFCFDQAEFLADAMALDEAYWGAQSRHLSVCATDRMVGLSVFADQIAQWLRREQSDLVPSVQHLARSMTANVLAAFAALGASDDAGGKAVRARLRALRVVRRVRDYLDGMLDGHECPTIIDLCRHAGVSQRTLQYCFLDTIGLTPIAYLRIARLHRARAELRNAAGPNVKVGDVAARWGFWHLSKFASDYRQLFGQLPSETLRPRGTG